MKGLERVRGAVVGAIGFILSPLSWWNDLYVNLPIAYVLASPVALFSERLFPAALVACYWVTNILGLLLLQKGAVSVAKGKSSKSRWNKKQLLFDFFISVLYTIVIVVLIYFDVLRAPQEYFDYSQ